MLQCGINQGSTTIFSNMWKMIFNMMLPYVDYNLW